MISAAPRRFVILLLVLFLNWSMLPNRSAAVDTDQTDSMLKQMCARGLAPTAIEICRMRIERATDRGAERSRWTMRLMECLAQSALRAPQTDDSQWQEALSVWDKYRTRYPTDTRLPWLMWQAARVDLLKAQSRLAQWLAAPADDASREAALSAVRRIQNTLDELDRDIGKRLPLATDRDTADKQAPSKQLLELRVDAALLRCESLALRAQGYPADSKDRIAAAGDIYRTATEVIQRAPIEWPSRDELITAAAAAGLEIGRAAESIRVLEQIAAGMVPSMPTPDGTGTIPAPPPSDRARIRAASASIEYHCRTGNAARAAVIANLFRSLFPGPESAIADIRVQLATMAARPADARDGELEKVIEQTKQVGVQYGDYWQRRAESLLVDSQVKTPEAPTQPNQLAKDLVKAEVKQLLAAGKTAAAAEKLKSAAETASVGGQKPQALEFALQAAAVMQKDKDWLRAADLLDKISSVDASVEGSASAHGQACWLIAQALRSNPKDKSLTDRYEQCLRSQLDLWPDDAESLEPEEWLVTWLSQRKTPADLIALWQRRITRCKEPAGIRRALSRWLDSIVSQDSRAAVEPALNSLKQDLAKLQSVHAQAVTVLVAAHLFTSDMQLIDAEAIVGEKLPTSPSDDMPDDAVELWRITAALAAAARNNPSECAALCREADFGLLSGPIVKGWIRSMFERIDESPQERTATFGPILLATPEWSSLPKAGKESRATQAVAFRLQLLRASGEKAAEATLQGIHSQLEKLRESAPDDGRTAILTAGAEAAHFPNLRPHAIRILQTVAIADNAQSEQATRARILEILWLQAAGETSKAAELAAQTLATRDVSQPWNKRRLESFVPKR